MNVLDYEFDLWFYLTEYSTTVLQLIFIIIEKEKEVEDLRSQLRERYKQNETLKQSLIGN